MATGSTSKKLDRLRIASQILLLHKRHISNAEISRRLQVSPQRVGQIIKRGRAEEKKRGLGSPATSKTSRHRSIPKSAIPSWLHQSILAPTQAIRNTCFEHGFRFNLDINCMQNALRDALGLQIPIRTLRRYRFDSVQIHHMSKMGTPGWSRLSLPDSTQNLIAKGMHIEQIIGQSVYHNHDSRVSIVEDKRNRIIEHLTQNKTSLTPIGGCLRMAFCYSRHDVAVKTYHKDRIRDFLLIAQTLRQVILDLIDDPTSGICPVKYRKSIIDIIRSILHMISTPPLLRINSLYHTTSRMVRVSLLFDVNNAGRLLGSTLQFKQAKANRILVSLDRVYKRLMSTATDLPPSLKGLNQADIQDRRRALYRELLSHGSDISRHFGDEKDNQLYFHR